MVPEKKNTKHLQKEKQVTSLQTIHLILMRGEKLGGVSEIHAYFMAPGTELPLMELKGRWNRLTQGGLENQRYQKQPFMNETTFCLGNG